MCFIGTTPKSGVVFFIPLSCLAYHPLWVDILFSAF
nr:MAG TPA: hypothetical protein [Caudoviricetes sp.]